MKIITLLVFAVLFSGVLAEDQGDWVDTNNLPIEFHVHPFYAGYLPIGADKSYFYVYHPS